jgi:hypothetical protein
MAALAGKWILRAKCMTPDIGHAFVRPWSDSSGEEVLTERGPGLVDADDPFRKFALAEGQPAMLCFFGGDRPGCFWSITVLFDRLALDVLC